MREVRLKRQEILLKKGANLISGSNKHGKKVERQHNNAFPAKNQFLLLNSVSSVSSVFDKERTLEVSTTEHTKDTEFCSSKGGQWTALHCPLDGGHRGLSDSHG